MNGLPYGLAEPLHIDEPFPTWKLALAGLLLWLLYRLFRRLRTKLASTTPVPSPAPRISSTVPGIAGVIDEIRRRYQANYRRGCHELAAALRRHFNEQGDRRSGRRHPYPILTASEIRERIGDTAISRLFGLLTELQFYRSEPSRSDFEGVCDLAIDVARGHPGARR